MTTTTVYTNDLTDPFYQREAAFLLAYALVEAGVRDGVLSDCGRPAYAVCVGGEFSGIGFQNIDEVGIFLTGVNPGTGDVVYVTSLVGAVDNAFSAMGGQTWSGRTPYRVGQCSFSSFSGDTEVLMADGTRKRIDQVEEGDLALATDPETGETGAREVVATLPHYDQLLTLKLSSGNVVTTEDHKYWNATDREWQESQHLDPGDRLLAADGDVVTVEGLDWATIHTAAAYDLTIDDLHTFYVAGGDEEVLVHNDNCRLTPALRSRLGSLAEQADETAADVIRLRGGGASQVNELQTGYGQLTLRELAIKANNGDAQAIKALKMVKQAGSQGKGGK